MSTSRFPHTVVLGMVSSLLLLSTGCPLVTVPDVVGENQAAAENLITGAGLTVGTVTEQLDLVLPPHQVLSQNPPAGASVAPGTAVNLVVSYGVT